MAIIDYLAVGHITQDVIDGGYVTGGTVAYAGRLASLLGCQTAVLSSAAPDFDWKAALPEIEVRAIPAAETTTFQNIYTENGRIQYLHRRARVITADLIPDDWRRPAIVHLAPLANEVEPAVVNLFNQSVVGVTAQGWLRSWDENGRVYPYDWPHAAAVLPYTSALVLSSEDLPDQSLLTTYRQLAPLVVMTQGADGCTVFMGVDSRQVPAPAVAEVEATGAGDIFAAAFFVRLHQTNGNPWEAARFANELAAISVTQRGLAAKIEAIRVALGDT